MSDDPVTRPPISAWGWVASKAIVTLLIYDALAGRGAVNWRAAIISWDDIARLEE